MLILSSLALYVPPPWVHAAQCIRIPCVYPQRQLGLLFGSQWRPRSAAVTAWMGSLHCCRHQVSCTTGLRWIVSRTPTAQAWEGRGRRDEIFFASLSYDLAQGSSLGRLERNGILRSLTVLFVCRFPVNFWASTLVGRGCRWDSTCLKAKTPSINNVFV